MRVRVRVREYIVVSFRFPYEALRYTAYASIQRSELCQPFLRVRKQASSAFLKGLPVRDFPFLAIPEEIHPVEVDRCDSEGSEPGIRFYGTFMF